MNLTDTQRTRDIALDLERLFQEPVPLTLGRLRDVLVELAALGPDGRASVRSVGLVLDRHGLSSLPLSSVHSLLNAVEGMSTSDDVAASFTPRQLEDLLSQVQ
jgi:hypothetical protein